MTAVKVFINNNSLKKNGEAAVYLIVHLGYKSLKFHTGVSCVPDDFNEKTLRIKGNSKKVKDYNLIIEKSLALMNDIFVRYRLQNISLTPELLKNEWKNPARRIDFYAFFDEAILERKKEIRPQTWKNHHSEINKLKLYKPKLAFSEISADMLDAYKRWLRTERKNDINSVFTSMKVLKTYINIAIKKGIITENPFNNVRTKQTTPEMVFLSPEELKLMWELYQENRLSTGQMNVLRHFLFMCFTGCRISDFVALNKFNVNSNLLIYYPIKTKGVKKTPVKVPLNKYAFQLIEDEKSNDDKLFHPITEQKMNVSIKKIAAEAKCFKPLTNHSARHTFATTWLATMHDLAALQKLLGHSKITDTMKYVHVTDEMLIEQMGRFQKNIFKIKKAAPPGTAFQN
jgi:site-specific recombinase XerD